MPPRYAAETNSGIARSPATTYCLNARIYRLEYLSQPPGLENGAATRRGRTL